MGKRKQFDLSNLQIEERLQGVQLASFTKRAIAYALDWAFIFLAAEFFPFAVFLLVLALWAKKRLRHSMQQSSVFIDQGLDSLDTQLASLEANERLRRRFVGYLRVYIHVVVYVVVVASLVVAASAIAGLFMPEQLKAIRGTMADTFFLQPFQGILTEINILSSLLGALFYFALFTWRWNGQTPGKRLLKIRVIRLNGRKISLWASFERVSGYTASASLLLMGFFQYYWDRNRQTTHDKITETIVVDISDETTRAILQKPLDQPNEGEAPAVSEEELSADRSS